MVRRRGLSKRRTRGTRTNKRGTRYYQGRKRTRAYRMRGGRRRVSRKRKSRKKQERARREAKAMNAGWRKFLEPTSGKEYFVSSDGQVTLWEAPTRAQVQKQAKREALALWAFEVERACKVDGVWDEEGNRG